MINQMNYAQVNRLVNKEEWQLFFSKKLNLISDKTFLKRAEMSPKGVVQMKVKEKMNQHWLLYLNESARKAGVISEQELQIMQIKIKKSQKASVKTDAFSIK